MRYFVCSDKDGKLDIIDMYKSTEEVLKRLKYHLKKEKCKLKVVAQPQMAVGCTIYDGNGSYYGTITYETNTLWGIAKGEKEDSMSNPYGKLRIDRWVIEHGFLVVDGIEFSCVEQALQMISELDSIVEETLSKLEHVGVNQVAFF